MSSTLDHAVNRHVDAVFVLSVRSFHDRISHIERELGRHGIAFEWIFEHDADELTADRLAAVFAPSDLKRGHQSLVLKHIETWQRCVERGYRRVLVFEDDAVLARDFERVFALAMREADALEQPYMVYLGCGDNKYVEGARRSSSMLLAPDSELPATDATVFDRRAAELRLMYVARHKVKRPADWLMREADAAMGIKHYWLREPIVEQGSMNGRFVSVLDERRTDRGRLRNAVRFRWDRWRRRTLGSTRPQEARTDFGAARRTARRDIWAVSTGRSAAALAAIGAFVSPVLANAAAGVMLLALLAAPSRGARLQGALSQPLARASLLLLGVLALATTWSPLALPDALREWFGWRPFAWLLCSLALFDSVAAKYRFAAFFTVAAGATACTSLVYWAFDMPQSANPALVFVVFRNHVTQAMAFAAAALFALVLATRSAATAGERVAWGGAAVVLLAALLLSTAGRSGYVVLGVSALVITGAGLLRGGTQRRIYAVAATAVAALLVLSPMVGSRFAEGLKELREAPDATALTSMGIRVAIWSNTARMIGEAPLLGHGLGSFGSTYRNMVGESTSDWRARPSDDPHNQYLLFLAETGALGLVAFLWWLAAAVRQPVGGTFRIVGLALLLSWCATSLFSSHFHTFNEGHMIALFAGVFLARETERQPASAASTAASTSS